ncbi:MAG: DUF4197 domain-containing protein [Bacteroidetes bacterium]|nr:DUF4197 domain-containing protein [Bacteroidota bacterium]
MKKTLLIAAVLGSTVLSAQVNLNKLKTQATTITKTNKVALSEKEVIDGLKEALSKGSSKAGQLASAVGGFNGNSLIHIPFPEDAQKMETKLRTIGMGSQVDKFVNTLNEAAELASKQVGDIFLTAIKNMTVKDGMNILKGNDDAATQYLNSQTYQQLYDKFKPIVVAALKQVEITKYWNPLMTRYNSIPLVDKVNPDLEDYTTKKAIEGLFKLVAQEELKIRKDINSRTSELLKKVFGEADKRK